MNECLARARWRLTIAYVAVFAAILTLFGVAVLWVSTREMIASMDESLHEAGDLLDQVVSEAARSNVDLATAAQALRVPGRSFYLFGPGGRPLLPVEHPDWLTTLASDLTAGELYLTVEGPDELNVEWRVYGRVMSVPGRPEPVVGMVVADFLEVEDRYPGLVGAFALAALGALLLVAIGGSILARKSIEPAEHAFRQLRRFTADAAHELRTPVSVIQASSEVALQHQRSSEEYEGTLASVLDETRRVSDTLDKLLTLSRADAGDWPVELEDLYLDDLVSDLASRIGALAARKGVELEVGADDECPVRGDRNLLGQLVMILCDNAIEFTPAGRRVRVEAERRGPRSALVVSDSGIGMTADERAKAFDRFYRADDARERGGAGLGLSIAEWIVRVHDARIELESEPGAGTTVRVVFNPRSATRA